MVSPMMNSFYCYYTMHHSLPARARWWWCICVRLLICGCKLKTWIFKKADFVQTIKKINLL